MFPPWVMLPLGVVNFAALHFALQRLGGQADGLLLTWRMGLGALSLVGISLLLRIYDELKDAQTDLALGEAGDPSYVDRPLVTGQVTVEDLRILRWVVTGGLVALNVPLGFPHPILAFGGVMLLTWLSYRWFFWPAVSRNLLLAFVTHNPLTAVVGCYVVSVYLAEFDQALSPWTAALLVGLWMPVAAWEVARKVRLPEEETDYDTYSKRLGWRAATGGVVFLTAVSLACLVTLSRALDLSWIVTAVLAVGAALPLGACARLLIAPRSARLRPWAEGYLAVANLTLAVGLLVQEGVRTG